MTRTSEMARLESDLKSSVELRARFEGAARRIADAGEATSDADAMAKAAAELGYGVSASDVEKMIADAENLDEEELVSVAAGNLFNNVGGPLLDGRDDMDNHAAWCVAAWHCYTGFMHTEGSTKEEKCMRNYACVFAYE